MPARASSRRGLLAIGAVLVVLLGIMDVLLRNDDSVLRSVWDQLVPSSQTPAERALRRRLPGR